MTAVHWPFCFRTVHTFNCFPTSRLSRYQPPYLRRNPLPVLFGNRSSTINEYSQTNKKTQFSGSQNLLNVLKMDASPGLGTKMSPKFHSILSSLILA